MQEELTSNLKYNFIYCIYLTLAFYYFLQLSSDYSSNFLLLITLLSLASLFSHNKHRYVLILMSLLSLSDFGIKIALSLDFGPSFLKEYFHYECVKNLISFSEQSLNESCLVYLAMITVAFLLAFTYNVNQEGKKQNLDELNFLKFMSECLEFITPLLIYALVFTKIASDKLQLAQLIQSFSMDILVTNLQILQQISWSLLAALYLIANRQSYFIRKSITFCVILLIVYDHNFSNSYPSVQQYQLQNKIIWTIKMSLLLCFRVHHKAQNIIKNYEERQQDISSNRISSYQKFSIKRKITLKQSRNQILVLVLILLTVIAVILTNGLGNIVIVIGLAINFPNYQENTFRTYMAVGVTISMILQPTQFIYFLFLFIVKYLTTFDHNFKPRNWWMLTQLGRLTILLSKVSLLNFLIGLLKFQILVVFTLIFRIFCSYFGLIIVFMGTDDNYQYLGHSIIPSSIGTDVLLWTYLFLLKFHSPSSTVKFQGTGITDIFYEYPILLRFQKMLKVLKIFPWFAYSVISLFILNSPPSILTFMRIVPLMMAFTIGIFEYRKSIWQERLWNLNLYTSLIIAFIKYFYLLSKYDNLSPWLIALLQPLQRNYKFIGLTPPDNLSLWRTFSADCAIILINAIVLFIIKVQLSQLNYQEQKQRIFKQENLENRLLPEENEHADQKNIHYLYRNYVKAIQIQFKERSRFRPFLTDFILDTCFLSFLLIFITFPNQSYSIFYMPHFVAFFIGFLRQRGKHNCRYIFRILIGIGSMDLFSLYVFYFIDFIKATDAHYSLRNTFCKYMFLIIAVIFNQTNNALVRFYQQNKVTKKAEYSYYLFRILSLSIPNQKLKKQVIILLLHLFKVTSIAFFISSLIVGPYHFKLAHSATLVLIATLLLLPCINNQDLYKKDWTILFIGCIFLDIWAGYFYCFLYFSAIRGYIMMLQEFNLLIAAQKYGITNKTSNDETKKRVEQVEEKFQNQNKLQIIAQVKQMRQKQQSYVSFGEDSVHWSARNTYVTVVWLLPIIFVLLIQLGVLYYVNNIFGFLLFSSCLIVLMYALIYLESFTIQSTMVYALVVIISLKVVAATVYREYYLPANQHSDYSGLGLFLILIGLLSYYQFCRYVNKVQPNKDHEYRYYIDFSLKRSQEAIQYWKKKCELVSELGSQIHNQKKMVSLRKFFLNRQNLVVKVQQLTSELKQKSSHRNSQFKNLERLQEQQAQSMLKKQEFQVYSNMLTFMSIEDLQYCYLHLNQYYNGETGIYIDLAKSTAEARQWVLQNYEHSIYSTLSRYNKLVGANLLLIQKAISIVFQKEEEQKEDNDSNKLSLSNRKMQNEGNIISKASLQGQPVAQDQISAQSRLQNKDLCGQRIDERLNELNWLVRKLVQNIQILGLMVAAGWNFFGGVYTIPTNIAIFSWAIVLETKTTVVFWLFLLIYTSVILSCKLLLNYLPKHLFINFIFYYHSSYFYEYLIIVVCAVEIIFLKMGGTSQIAYSQRQNIFDAFYRNVLNESSRGKVKNKESEFLSVYKKERHATKHSFFYRVFSKGRLKPGKDLYPIMAIVQLIILLYIFFFYDMMEFQSKNNRKSLGQILTVTQFSKNMILALFFQVIIMIADRVIVALNFIDIENQKLENFIFNFTFKTEMKFDAPSEEDLQKLSRFDFLLILKYLFHVLMLFAINFFVYFYIPSGGLQKSIIPQCENAVCGKSYSYLSIFLFLYLVYFLISGLQIKHGFNRNKCRNTLMERYHWINYYIYLFFTGIPFLWEFKKISDWTTTSTALPLFHWMKFEDINARMYQSKCEQQILKIKPMGIRVWYKYLMGPLGFFFILALIFSPIIIYSSFNPFAVQDSILATSFRLQLVMQNNVIYDFFQTSHTSILDGQILQDKHRSVLGLFDRANLYKLQTSRFPDQDFMLSQPAVQQLAKYIREAAQNSTSVFFEMRLIVSVSEKEGGQSVIEWGKKQLDTSELSGLYSLITCNQSQLWIHDFYSPFPGELDNQSIIITSYNQGQYFQLSTYRELQQQTPKGLYIFYKSSVKYKIAIGLLTFYLTYVVLINSLFRFYFTGGLQNILFEGCELQKILFLCEAVRSARILQNFYQEEYIYWSLVDLMRYPKMIKQIASQFTDLKRQHQD